jgi:hypothetical protein
MKESYVSVVDKVMFRMSDDLYHAPEGAFWRTEGQRAKMDGKQVGSFRYTKIVIHT